MNTDFMCFKEFDENLTVVNDITERGVKLISDVIDISEDEKQRHCITHREKYPIFTKDVLNKL